MKWHSRILIIFLFLSSCTGYRIKKNTNPFSTYGINSVSIPMFLNRSSLSNVSGPMTKEITLLLSENENLKIYGGEDKKADALLIGIINSADKRVDIFKTTGTKFTSGELETSIGNRNPFFVPISTTYKLNLRLVLIKNPSKADIKLVHSEWAPYLKNHPKVIFNEIFNLEHGFSRAVSENTSTDSGGVVNFTKNKAFFQQSISVMARNAAKNFKEVVLDAF